MLRLTALASSLSAVLRSVSSVSACLGCAIALSSEISDGGLLSTTFASQHLLAHDSTHTSSRAYGLPQPRRRLWVNNKVRPAHLRIASTRLDQHLTSLALGPGCQLADAIEPSPLQCARSFALHPRPWCFLLPIALLCERMIYVMLYLSPREISMGSKVQVTSSYVQCVL